MLFGSRGRQFSGRDGACQYRRSAKLAGQGFVTHIKVASPAKAARRGLARRAKNIEFGMILPGIWCTLILC